MKVVQMLGLLAGGLALFLFGLELMTHGLKSIAGSRLQDMLEKMTANRARGVLAGAVVTAVLNSSTITTVLMVGFVSAGMMTLAQSVPMIMGANIGSTVTAQIVAFNVSALAPYLLALGFVGHAFARQDVVRQLGGVVLGFGMLFLGIQFMSDATHPLRSFQPFIDAMQDMKSPILGIAVGAVFTAIVQSSAATLGIIIALAGQALIPLEAGIALILGANVGTCGTALLAAIGKPPEALQVGIVHLLFNVLGVLFFVFFIPQLADFVRLVSPASPDLEGAARLAAETPRQVANTHTIFSVASTLILVWFVTPIARLAQRIAPARRQAMRSDGQPQFLDDGSLAAASLGLERVRLEVTRLGTLVLRLIRTGLSHALDADPPDSQSIIEDDRQIDALTSSILLYIGRLSQVEHSEAEGRQMVALTRITSSLDGVRDVVMSNLVLARPARLEDGAALDRLRNAQTAEFEQAVIGNLELTMARVGRHDIDDEAAGASVASKAQIERLAQAARRSVFEQVRLEDQADVPAFRRAMDLIEYLRQIERFSRRIAKTARELAGH